MDLTSIGLRSMHSAKTRVPWTFTGGGCGPAGRNWNIFLAFRANWVRHHSCWRRNALRLMRPTVPILVAPIPLQRPASAARAGLYATQRVDNSLSPLYQLAVVPGPVSAITVCTTHL
jgi:hypothetical protein